MKRNHHEPPAGQNPPGGNLVEQSLQLFEFFIDRDSQRLKHARGGVCSAPSAGRGLLNQPGQLLGG